MTIDVRSAGDAVIWLGAVAAALAAMGVVARVTVLRPLLRWLRRELQVPLQEARDAAAAVHAEVSPNSGRSMKDQVTRMDDHLTGLAKRLDDHLTNHPGGQQ